MTEVKLSEILFTCRKNLHLWPDKKINMCGPSGVISSVHTGRGRQVSKISTAALAMEKIQDGKLRTASAAGQPLTYGEYERDNGDVVRFFVEIGSGKEFNVTASDGFQIYMSVPAVYAALVTNECFKSELLAKGIRGLDEIHDMGQSSQLSENEMLISCDAFYYSIGKDYMVQITSDNSVFEPMLQRTIDSGCLTKTETAPVNLNITKTERPKKAKMKKLSLFTEPLADFYERCKNGEFLIKYEWEPELAGSVVGLDFLETFIPTETFRTTLLTVYYRVNKILERLEKGFAYEKLIGKTPINIKVMGKPGTGKTVMIQAILASLGYPCGIINCKARMEEDEIEGLNKFVNGYVKSIQTKAGEIHDRGGAIVLEEMNLPDPGILMGCLGQALEYPYILKADGYIEKKRHPLTIYFGTMNIGTNGSQMVNEAFSSRFPVGIILEDVPEDEFVGILSGNGYGIDDCRFVYKTYKNIITYLRKNQEELVLAVTMRHCLNALELIDIGFSREDACRNTMLSQIYCSDPDTAEDIENSIFKTLVKKAFSF